MRKLAILLHIPIGFLPQEIVLIWEFIFVVTAVVYIFQTALANQPFESFDIRSSVADLKDHIEIVLRKEEFPKFGVAVVFI